VEKRSTNRTLLLIVLAGVSYAGYWVYQNHLSSGFKRILVVACDGQHKENDESRYLNNAQTAARTKMDRQLLHQFQHMADMSKDVSQYDSHIWDRFDADLKDVEPAIPTPYHHLLALRTEYLQKHIPVPKSLQDDIVRAAQQQQEESVRRKQQEQIDKERTDQERQEILVLRNQLRAELGMPSQSGKN
jgi:hypothetical protein